MNTSKNEHMNLIQSYENNEIVLIEGAVGVRLRTEYGIGSAAYIAHAAHIYHDAERKALTEIYQQYIQIAEDSNRLMLLTTPTRRANKENVEKAGYTGDIFQDNVTYFRELTRGSRAELYIGGMMGCKGDAYKATEVLSAREAYDFHSWQADGFLKAGSDFLYAAIMPALPEAIGMAKAMEATGLPYIISFMLRENGRLIDGTTIHDAMETLEGETIRKPLCYMTNCIHPTILDRALSKEFNKTKLVETRFRGIQANASPLSPEELDGADELKTSDCHELADEMVKLHQKYRLKIYGGCCGTDHTHIAEMAKLLPR